jgi:NAD(P)-dependent dehydrogenase (short-subunit alcohol dehydrogenase family)
MKELEGKVAIVTGAGRERGIGLASVQELARHGAAVVLTDLARPAPELEMFGNSTVAEDTAVLDAATAEITAAGGRALAMAVDVRSEEEVLACVATTVEQFGTVDILFNNSGTGIGAQPFFDLDDNVWEQSWQINVMGMVRFCRTVLPIMQKAGGGSIINNASVAALRVWREFAAYSASKSAVVALTKALALDFGADGIRVNAVCPGEIDTQMGDLAAQLMIEAGIITPDQAGDPSPAIALGRSGVGDDVAGVVAWLAGPGSRYVTGTAIPVDGAWAEGL